MEIIANNITYNSLLEAMLNTYISLPIHELCCDINKEDEDIYDINYQGTYTFHIYFTEEDHETYEWVFCDITTTDDGTPSLILKPSKFPDERGFGTLIWQPKILNDYNIDFLRGEIGGKIFDEKNYEDPEKILCLNGTYRKLNKNDKYITIGKRNIEIIEKPLGPDGQEINSMEFTREEMEMEEFWEKMVKDNFMGKIVRKYVTNVGEQFEEEYFVASVDEEKVILFDYKIPPLNSRNLPNFIQEEGEEKITMVNIFYDMIYIPYSLDEEL